MTAEFYLFDIGVGQSAALKLPNGRWCIFDVGKSAEFSPVAWIADRNRFNQIIGSLILGKSMEAFRFLTATISHHHGDHLADCKSLLQYTPEYLLTVQGDGEYINDVIATNSTDSIENVIYLLQKQKEVYGNQVTPPDYAGLLITEMSLPIRFVRTIGGDANRRVNNASPKTSVD